MKNKLQLSINSRLLDFKDSMYNLYLSIVKAGDHRDVFVVFIDF
jgi:hypothetical protein